MSTLHSMLSAGGGALVNRLASQFGINPEQTTSAVSALVPMLAGGMKEKIASNDAGLASLLTSEKTSQFADNPSILDSSAALDTGNNLLTRIFSPGETSKIISTVAEKAGIGSDTVGRMLPIVTTLVGGFVSKSAASGGNLTDTLGQLSETGLMGAVKHLASKMFG